MRTVLPQQQPDPLPPEPGKMTNGDPRAIGMVAAHLLGLHEVVRPPLDEHKRHLDAPAPLKRQP
ncbi:hypothetical protein C3489_18285, partial [Streptomyces sp. Ru71]|uniref:hypothetical protein n=1 Tax=Streptomyces sp. Ru71 TaxID=2080746 RepID=UPI000D45C887